MLRVSKLGHFVDPIQYLTGRGNVAVNQEKSIILEIDYLRNIIGTRISPSPMLRFKPSLELNSMMAGQKVNFFHVRQLHRSMTSS